MPLKIRKRLASRCKSGHNLPVKCRGNQSTVAEIENNLCASISVSSRKERIETSLYNRNNVRKEKHGDRYMEIDVIRKRVVMRL